MSAFLRRVALVCLSTFCFGGLVWGQDDSGEDQGEQLGGRLWIAEMPGGQYAVALGAVTSVSVHEYVVDGAGKVIELTIDTSGNTTARFYALEAITDTPGGMAQSVVNTVNERINEVRERLDTAGISNAVVKNYPYSTHAHTVEYRLGSREAVMALHKSAFNAWRRGRGAKIKSE